MELTEQDAVYIRRMGRWVRITAVFTDDAAANEYMRTHEKASVIHTSRDGIIFLADIDDWGAVDA